MENINVKMEPSFGIIPIAQKITKPLTHSNKDIIKAGWKTLDWIAPLASFMGSGTATYATLLATKTISVRPYEQIINGKPFTDPTDCNNDISVPLALYSVAAITLIVMSIFEAKESSKSKNELVKNLATVGAFGLAGISATVLFTHFPLYEPGVPYITWLLSRKN